MNKFAILLKIDKGLIVSICLLTLSAGLDVNTVLAAGNGSPQQVGQATPISVRNKHRLPTKHSSRKAAARRLKVNYQKSRQQKLGRWVKAHHGYSGFGQNG